MVTKNDEIMFLNKLILNIRKLVNDDKMINKCDMCQGLIGKYLDECNIKYYACSTNNVIAKDITGHSFIVTIINNKYYLLDPAFVQFKYGYKEDVIINGIKCISKSPYHYLNSINNELTNELIENGYFLLDEDSAYAYGNAFYFTKTNIPSDMKLIPISGSVFIESFKKGCDQLKFYDTDTNPLYIK